MGSADFFAPGDYNADCSMCGEKYKASELIKHWQGMYRCRKCWEPRQPQDFVRGVKDVQSVPWSQPDIEVNIDICTINGRSAIPGYATPGCAIPGNLFVIPGEI